MAKGISVAARKAKGRELQKWVCEKISELLQVPWGRDADIESRPMGVPGVDIRISPRLRKRMPFSIECKRQEKWSINEWIKQAKENVLPKTHWLLIARSSRQDPVVIIDANTFFRILAHADLTQINTDKASGQ